MDVLLTMRAFRRVVERNSFYKAAEDLAITPAALSKQIKQLESRLGTLLLVRTTRSMSLTEAGQLYYQEACRGGGGAGLRAGETRPGAAG